MSMDNQDLERIIEHITREGEDVGHHEPKTMREKLEEKKDHMGVSLHPVPESDLPMAGKPDDKPITGEEMKKKKHGGPFHVAPPTHPEKKLVSPPPPPTSSPGASASNVPKPDMTRETKTFRQKIDDKKGHMGVSMRPVNQK